MKQCLLHIAISNIQKEKLSNMRIWENFRSITNIFLLNQYNTLLPFFTFAHQEVYLNDIQMMRLTFKITFGWHIVEFSLSSCFHCVQTPTICWRTIGPYARKNLLTDASQEKALFIDIFVICEIISAFIWFWTRSNEILIIYIACLNCYKVRYLIL